MNNSNKQHNASSVAGSLAKILVASLALLATCTTTRAQWIGAGAGGSSVDFDDTANWNGATINGSFTGNTGTASLQFDGGTSTSLTSFNFNSSSAVNLSLGTGTLLSGSTPATINLSGSITLPAVKGSIVTLGGVNPGLTGGSDLVLNLSNASHGINVPAGGYTGSGNNPVIVINAQLTGGGGSASFVPTYMFSGTSYKAEVVLANNNSTFVGNISPVSSDVFFTSIANRGTASSLGLGTVAGSGDFILTNGSAMSYVGSGNQSSNRKFAANTSSASDTVTLNNYAADAASTLTISGDFRGNGSGVFQLRSTTGNTIVYSGNISTSTGALAVQIGSTFTQNWYNSTGTVVSNIPANGKVTLSGNNTYSSETRLSSGTLNINSNTALGTGTFVVNAASTIDNTSGSTVTLTNNNAQTWKFNLTFAGTNDLNLGTGAVSLGDQATTTRTMTTTAGVLTVGGIISNGTNGTTPTVNFAKAGNGTLVLGGANAYTGTTAVNAGTLLVNGSLANGAVTVSANTTLGGNGTINGVTTVAGTLQGGDGSAASGTLNLAANLTLQSTSRIQLALGTAAAHSSLNRTGGTWAFNTTQSFNFLTFGAATGTYDNIISGLSGSEAGLGSIGSWTIENSGWNGTFTYDGAGGVDLVLSAVPEPSTFALLGLGAGALWLLRRRRNG